MKQNKNNYKLLGGFGLVILGLAVIFAWLILKPAKTMTEESERPRVVATFFPIYDFTNKIAGDKIAVDIIFTQTPEVSSFAPNDILKINNADLVIKNGVGMEPILDDLIAASDNKDVKVVDTSQGIELMGNLEPIEVVDGEAKAEHYKNHGLADPHIWLNPQNAIIQVRNIKNALVELDPENSQFYTDNAERYMQDLILLDENLAAEISRLPKKDFIAFHSAFQYFAKLYGLNQVAVIEEFPGKEPSARYISELISIIKESNADVIFSEPQFSPRIVQALASDLNLNVYSLNPAETGDLSRDSYISIMRENLSTIQTALK